MKRLFLFGFLLALVLAAGWVVWRRVQTNRSPHISASGGREMSLVLPELGRTYL